MRNLSKSFIGSLGSSVKVGLIVALGSASANAANGVMPLNDTNLHLPDGRIVEAIRCGAHCHCLTVKRASVVLHKQCYQEEFDRLWDYAFFVPIKPGQYLADVDGDGTFEIGVATWDGGNNIANRYALAFSIKGDRLVYFGRKRFNLEYGSYLYE